ncbi:unnamed protein product [Lampetra fluviatilis]
MRLYRDGHVRASYTSGGAERKFSSPHPLHPNGDRGSTNREPRSARKPVERQQQQQRAHRSIEPREASSPEQHPSQRRAAQSSRSQRHREDSSPMSSSSPLPHLLFLTSLGGSSLHQLSHECEAHRTHSTTRRRSSH